MTDNRAEHPNRKVPRDRYTQASGGIDEAAYVSGATPAGWEEPNRLYSLVDPEGRKTASWHDTQEGAMMRSESVALEGDRFVGPQGHTLMSLDRRGWTSGIPDNMSPGERAGVEKQARLKRARKGK